jgi:uncharacterized membrane protein
MDTIARYIFIFVLSLMPTIEVRGSVPMVFILFRNNYEASIALVIAIVSNLIIAPILFLALDWFNDMIMTSKRFPSLLKNIYLRVLRYARSKGTKINRYSLVGLLLFVAIPLPGTGAWTGSIVAYVLGFDKKKSIIAIELGVIMASLIVLFVTVLGIEILKRIFML